MQATFKRAFGVVPEGMEEEQAAAEDGGGGDEGTSLAISEWQLRALSLEAAAAEAAGAAAAGSGASQEEEQSAATGDVQPRAVAASE